MNRRSALLRFILAPFASLLGVKAAPKSPWYGVGIAEEMKRMAVPPTVKPYTVVAFLRGVGFEPHRLVIPNVVGVKQDICAHGTPTPGGTVFCSINHRCIHPDGRETTIEGRDLVALMYDYSPAGETNRI